MLTVVLFGIFHRFAFLILAILTDNELKEKLRTPQKIVITTHFKPDGDAMGSSLALFHWLRQYGHEVRLIVPSDYPTFLFWMPGQDDVLVYPQDQNAADTLINDADLTFALDYNNLSRIQSMELAVRTSTSAKILIDHHLEPEGFDSWRLWDPEAASTAQLVYKFLVTFMEDRAHINADIATCLYTGIMTDTGSFRFQRTTAEVHLITADLITLGAENWRIHEFVFNSSSEDRLKFLGFCLLNRLEVVAQYNTALFSVSKEDLLRFNVGTGDTEGLVNYALSVTDIRLAALVIERPDKVKVSLRSVDEVPCNEICSTYFNGGGHKNAAGGSSEESLPAVVQKFKDILPHYKDLLTQ